MYLANCSKTQHLSTELLSVLPQATALHLKKQVFAGGEFSIALDLDNTTLSNSKKIIVLQNFSTDANNDLMELFLTLDALNRTFGTINITLIIPYFAYSRQDKANNSALALKVIAKLLGCFNINKLLTIDLHNPCTTGFFDFPVVSLSTAALFARNIKQEYEKENILIIAPDLGSASRARAVAELLDAEYIIINKERHPAHLNMQLTDSVAGKDCIIIDDMVASGLSVGIASKLLLANGAKTVSIYASHLLDFAVNIANLSNIHRFYTTNSLATKYLTKPSKVLDITHLIAQQVLAKETNF